MATVRPTFSASFISWARQSISYLWLIVLAGYFAVAAGTALYHTYQDNQQTASLDNQLAADNLEKARLQALLVYYNTDAYKENQLRASLLLQLPGEKVYALPESSAARTAEQDAAADLPQQAKKPVSNLPVWQQWLQYLWSGTR